MKEYTFNAPAEDRDIVVTGYDLITAFADAELQTRLPKSSTDELLYLMSVKPVDLDIKVVIESEDDALACFRK